MAIFCEKLSKFLFEENVFLKWLLKSICKYEDNGVTFKKSGHCYLYNEAHQRQPGESETAGSSPYAPGHPQLDCAYNNNS
jgi:hypothetical protein